MNRRNIFHTVLATAAGALAAKAASPARAEEAETPKVVYHLSDLEKVAFVLGNIRNHIDGMGGPDKVKIAVVVHGPALKAFHKATVFNETSTKVAGFSKAGVQFEACVHTMAGQNVKLGDLLGGFAVAEKGGVVRLAELQRQGWAYLRP